MQGMLKNAKGISALSLILLLLASGIVGAVLSYLWTEGYYANLRFNIPRDVGTIAITNVTFPRENSTYFNVTALHPSYSGAENVSITGIALIANVNNTETILRVSPGVISPIILPTYSLERGENVTFQCSRNWGEFAGQRITVVVFVQDGSGATMAAQTELVRLVLSGLEYNTLVTINQFNITLRNTSAIPLDMTKILLGIDEIPAADISVDGQNITFPYRIPANESRKLTCRFPLWDIETNSGYLGTTNKIVVETLQGYQASLTATFTDPVILTISNVTYPLLNTTQFILSNSQDSPHQVNLDNVTIRVGNQTYTVANTNATDYVLVRGANVTIVCTDGRFNWESWKGQKITITVNTTQGFVAKKEETIP